MREWNSITWIHLKAGLGPVFFVRSMTKRGLQTNWLNSQRKQLGRHIQACRVALWTWIELTILLMYSKSSVRIDDPAGYLFLFLNGKILVMVFNVVQSLFQ